MGLKKIFLRITTFLAVLLAPSCGEAALFSDEVVRDNSQVFYTPKPHEVIYLDIQCEEVREEFELGADFWNSFAGRELVQFGSGEDSIPVRCDNDSVPHVSWKFETEGVVDEKGYLVITFFPGDCREFVVPDGSNTFIAAHETGHCLGLGHSVLGNSIMCGAKNYQYINCSGSVTMTDQLLDWLKE